MLTQTFDDIQSDARCCVIFIGAIKFNIENKIRDYIRHQLFKPTARCTANLEIHLYLSVSSDSLWHTCLTSHCEIKSHRIQPI